MVLKKFLQPKKKNNMLGDIFIILLVVAYLIVGIYVAAKEDDKFLSPDPFDSIISGILGAFWPLTVLFNWIVNDSL